MRFISKHRGYSMTGRSYKPQRLEPDGVKAEESSIVLDFQPNGSGGMGGLSPWEKEAALEHFQFAAKGYDEDLTHRLSVFDTEAAQAMYGWSDSLREQMEDRLMDGMSYGVDYIQVDAPRVPAPWPAYDGLSDPDEIAARVRELGFDVGPVIAYELQNKNREQVVAALEALTAEVTAPEEPVIRA